ncbi:MAG TPA: hypothetical protein PLC15_24445 [Candidatus Obscuribacter sp.]|nr:hypothetical protein [Candidatus Obscuribacter sp.]
MAFRAGTIMLGLLLALMPTAVQAQGSPVPGQNNSYVSPSTTYGQAGGVPASSGGYAQAPVPGAASSVYSSGSAGGPLGTAVTKTGKSAYSKLPLNVDDAKVRIAELRNLLAVSRPQDVQDAVFQLCEWLSDMADAHWKLSLALAKNDAMKAAAAQERQSAVKFSSLKHEAGLLKAELFIKQNRMPEALAPLVDIVVAEPKSVIGQAAYEKLKEIGFSEEAAGAAYQPVEKVTERASSATTELKAVGELKSVSPVLKTVPGQLKPVAPLKTVGVESAKRTAQVTKTR